MIQYPSKNDIINAMKNPVCFKVDELFGGKILIVGSRPVCYTGGYASVFPFIKANGNKVVVRCWFADIGNPGLRMNTIAAYLTKLNSKYFVKFKYYENGLLINGSVFPIMIMDWAEFPTLKEYINDHKTDRTIILKISDNFKEMVQYFHQNRIAHGDLSHGNIKVQSDGSLLVVDYDSMYITSLNGMPDIIKGLPGYQHPERKNNQTGNLSLDYFSELVIYLSLIVYADYPFLWQEYFETEDLLFSKSDFESPNSSRLFNFLKNSPNCEISILTEKLIEFLKHKDISELSPLEDVFKDKYFEIAKDIINKF